MRKVVSSIVSERKLRIVFASGVSGLTERNGSFDSGVLRVAYTGRNRNNSFISRETFERCMPSIYNCPIVCRYDRQTDSIGGHDMELVTDGGGNMRIVNITQPVGVVPESARYWWEDIEDNSGLHEYLCVDVLLWKRQEAYRKIREDGITDESMEISVKDGAMEDGVYVIRDFEFNAFCLLGSVEPCFESAALEMFSKDDFREQMEAMMRDFKESFLAVSSTKEGEDKLNFSTEGGDGALDEKIALVREYGFDADKLEFSLDELTADELREKLEALKAAGENAGSFGLEGNFQSELMDALGEEKVEACWGTDSRYWFWDYDRDLSEVYATDITDWKLYGFVYAMDGDSVKVDFSSKKRMKVTVEPFDGGSAEDPAAGLFARLAEKVSAKEAEWAGKFQAEAEKNAGLEGELKELREFKRDAEDRAAENERTQILGRFADLEGIEAFEALKADHAGMTAEALEEKCYAIRGRSAAPAKFALEQGGAPKLKVEKAEPEEKEPYGGIFAEFGIKPVTK